ncbi:MAG: metallophosphoesterase, partial [Acetobacteraceae bacterium]
MPDFVPAPATLPSGLRIYAIGDVHGCLEKLIALQQAIAEDIAARPVERAIRLYLGDYVDRGPDSAGVVNRLVEGTGSAGARVVHLMGNHEDLMLGALDARTPDAVALWMMNGGAESLLSWGIPRNAEPDSWITRIPARHLAFLRELSMSHAAGGYL